MNFLAALQLIKKKGITEIQRGVFTQSGVSLGRAFKA